MRDKLEKTTKTKDKTLQEIYENCREIVKYYEKVEVKF